MAIKDRLDLHNKLGEIFGAPDRVYFQPPSGFQLKYPCLVYTVKNGDSINADNVTYAFFPFYDVTHIYKNPDEGLTMTKKLMLSLSGIRYDRAWRVDNLYHENLVVW